jgi:hypothetical protein
MHQKLNSPSTVESVLEVSVHYNTIYMVDSKGFWRWCIILRITGFLNFVHCPMF